MIPSKNGLQTYRVTGSDVRNFKITIEYDGTRYCGWQRQNNDPSIQEEIEKALKTMTGLEISLIGSGRTDAGVHAYAQVANFKCDTQLQVSDFMGGLNSLTADDIVITACEEVDDKFHARYRAKSKLYVYKILNSSNPSAISRHFAWHVRKDLDIAAMRTAIDNLIGEHDFKAFEGAGSPRPHTIRKILGAELIEASNHFLAFEIEADGFLRFMVRNIVGTLVQVGNGKISPQDFKRILDSKDRSQAGPTAPAHGLYLKRVKY
jgi:tRNA pseudouridine38-40 synthase